MTDKKPDEEQIDLKQALNLETGKLGWPELQRYFAKGSVIVVADGIDRKDLQIVGRGKEMLVVKDGDRDEQWANRRVELHVVHS